MVRPGGPGRGVAVIQFAEARVRANVAPARSPYGSEGLGGLGACVDGRGSGW